MRNSKSCEFWNERRKEVEGRDERPTASSSGVDESEAEKNQG